MEKLEIASAETVADFKLIELLAQKIWREYYTPIIGAEQVEYMLANFQSYEAICNQTEREGYCYYLFKAGNVSAGYMAISHQGKELFLSKLYVLKEHRNHGIASHAITFLQELCRQEKLEKIWLTVNKNNEDSIAVYKTFGFETVRSQAADIGCGFVMDDYIMEKEI